MPECKCSEDLGFDSSCLQSAQVPHCHVFRLVAVFKLNWDRATLLPRDKMNIEVATSSSWLDREYEAKEVNLIDPLSGNG